MLRPYDDGDPPYPFTRREVDNMTTRRSILIGTAIVAGTALWYLFRPEALVISKTVSESFPAAEHAMSSMTKSPGMSAMPAHEAVKVVSGRFHSNAHKTDGLARSEEHTSELQSRLHLVCRLLLEKKKKKHKHSCDRPLAHVIHNLR